MSVVDYIVLFTAAFTLGYLCSFTVGNVQEANNNRKKTQDEIKTALVTIARKLENTNAIKASQENNNEN